MGGDLLTYLSHSQRDFAMFVKIALITLCFFFVIIFLANAIPKPSFKRSESHLILRWSRRFSGAVLLAFCLNSIFGTNSYSIPRGQVSVAGFDFRCESARVRQ